MMVDTSLDAYAEVRMTLTTRQNEVYELIKNYPNRTAAEYARLLIKPVNAVSGRFGELRKIGRIKRVEKRQCFITKGMAWTLRVI